MKHPKVKHWDDERSLGNSLIITTIEGWAFEPSPDERIALHVKGFDTKKEALAELKLVSRCACQRCGGK